MTKAGDQRVEAERVERPAMERAEELVGHAGQRVGALTSLTALRIRKLAALAREEAEDVWAEAHNVRQRR